MFRIYYADRPPFDSEENPGQAPPSRGVLVIVQDHPEIGRHTQAKTPYYAWRQDEGRWIAIEDLVGLFDYLIDTGLVLFGRTVSTARFNDAMREALADMNDAKLGWLDGEPRPTD